jgi:hypothetical protein
MAFGQQAGPPATARQVQELLALVEAAGHEGFRGARHPLGLTQRQAGGKFTGDEAQALIDLLLEQEHHGSGADGAPPPVADRVTAGDRRRASLAQQLRKVPDDLLAEELQRRGWGVVQP